MTSFVTFAGLLVQNCQKRISQSTHSASFHSKWNREFTNAVILIPVPKRAVSTAAPDAAAEQVKDVRWQRAGQPLIFKP